MSTEEPVQSALRVPALDGVRGLAILLVVPHNSSLMLERAFHGPAYIVKELSLMGWTGVQLFFVLSGFLISGGLLDTQRGPGYFRTFYARRILRIFPLYYGVLILAFLVLSPLGLLPAATVATDHNQVWLWLFLSNWTDPRGLEVTGFAHFWSLAVEEQFYLLWPLLLYRLSPQQVLRACVAICLAALAIRIGMHFADYPPEYLYHFTFCRMDALAMGAAAAAMLRIPSWRARVQGWLRYLPWATLTVFAVGALLTHDYGRTGPATQTFGYTILALVFTMLVLWASQLGAAQPTFLGRLLSLPPLRSLGKYSYAMYVFHFPLTKLLGLYLLGSVAHDASATVSVLYAATITVVSYLLAVASYHLYEKRFLRLKHYFEPVRPPVTEQPA